MNNDPRETSIARSMSDNRHQYPVTGVHADIRNCTRSMLHSVLLVFALPLVLLAEDDLGSVAEMSKRIAALERELKILRTQALPFKNMVELKLRMPSGIVHRERTEDEVAKQAPIHLSHSMVLFLGLSDAELAAMSGVVHTTNQKLAAEIAKQSPVLVKMAKGYRLEIMPFAREGKLIEDDFLKRSEEVLGPDRLQLWRSHVENDWFFHFGKATCAYTLFATENDWGPGYVMIRDSEVDKRASVESQRPSQFMDDVHVEVMGGMRIRFGYDFILPYLTDDLIREFAAERRAQLQWFADREAAREREKARVLIKADDVKNF